MRDLTLLLTLVAIGGAVGAGGLVGWVAAEEPAARPYAVPRAFSQQQPLQLRLSERD